MRGDLSETGSETEQVNLESWRLYSQHILGIMKNFIKAPIWGRPKVRLTDIYEIQAEKSLGFLRWKDWKPGAMPVSKQIADTKSDNMRNYA